MFAKLALRNVKRQISSYLIYFVTVTLSVALMFAVNNLSYSDRIRKLAELATDVEFLFRLVTVLSCLVTALVLSYAAGFMLKLRKKEFGMYLTLGMTRWNIQTLFACETGILFLFALILGIGLGLVIYQLLAALFASIMEMPFTLSPYSAEGIFLTIVTGAGLFAVSTLASLRYLKRVTVTELLKEENTEKSEKHPVLWCCLSVITAAGLFASLFATYGGLLAAFHNSGSAELMLWLVLDLVMVFSVHVTLSRTIAGMLLKSRRLKNSGTNTVVLRGLSGKMTMNSLLIGALATLLVFAIVMSNVAFGEKIRSDYSIPMDCPYDVLGWFDTDEQQDISMEEGRKIIQQYSSITGQIDFSLYSTAESTLCSNIMGYQEMNWTDLYMPLSQFNRLLVGCGHEPITLEDEYLLVTSIQEIRDVPFDNKTVTLNGRDYSWAGSSTSCPNFVQKWFYFVVPDDAVKNMATASNCVACTLENKRPDVQTIRKDLTYLQETEYGQEEQCDFLFQEEVRLYSKATSGTLVIGTLYVATVFVCLALAILSLKMLSTLNDERRRFAVLYRLGADAGMQKKALLRQTGAFFFMPFALPLLLTVPFGVMFGKIYEIWDFTGLNGQKAMETAVLIALVITGIYALYFMITYRIACSHVICHDAGGNEK